MAVPNPLSPKQKATPNTAPSGSYCLLGFGGIPGTSILTRIFSLNQASGNVGSVCLFSKTEARALIGALLLAAGAGTGFVGLAVLTVSAFSKTKAGQTAGRAVGSAAEGAGAAAAVLGAPEAGAVLSKAGSHVRSHAGGKKSQTGRIAPARREVKARAGREQNAQAEHEGRQFDQVMARKRDSARGPAIRDTEDRRQRQALEEVPF
jgi:hypothetical protein